MNSALPPHLPPPPRRRVELHDANRTRPDLTPPTVRDDRPPTYVPPTAELPNEPPLRYDGVAPLVAFVVLVVGLLLLVLWVLPVLLVP